MPTSVFYPAKDADSGGLIYGPGDPSSKIANATNTSINVGIVTTKGVGYYYAFLQFDLSTIASTAIVSASTLTVTITAPNDASANSRRAQICQITGTWTEVDNTVTPTVATGTYYGVIGTDSASWGAAGVAVTSTDIASLVQKWVNGTFTNYGLCMVPMENTGTTYRQLASREYTGTTSDPYLTVTYTTNQTVSPSGIASAQAFGGPTMVPGSIAVSTAGNIATAEAFGNGVLASSIAVTPTGIASMEAFGNPILYQAYLLSPAGIASAEAVGNPTLSASIKLFPTGVASLEALGLPTVKDIITVAVRGITDPRKRPKGYWHPNFYNQDVSQFLLDQSGNRNHLHLGSVFPAYINKGALVLPGIAGQYASTSDSPAIHVVGDSEWEWWGALEDWTPSATQTLAGRYDTAGVNRSFLLQINSLGQVTLFLSPDGTTASQVSVSSSVAVPVADGEYVGLKITWRQSDGRVQFWYWSAGAWTQIGVDRNIVIASIFPGTRPLEIGSYNSGAVSLMVGRCMRFVYRNGIGGAAVAIFDANQPDFATEWVSETGEVWTVNRTGALAVENKYVRLPGLTSQIITNKDVAKLDTPGDLDVSVRVAADRWITGASQTFIGKWISTTLQRGWIFDVTTAGRLRLQWSNDGSSTFSAQATADHGFADGSVHWFRFTIDVDNGAGSRIITFYTADGDLTNPAPGDWVQLGAPVIQAAVTSIMQTGPAVSLDVGAYAGGSGPMAGNFYRAIVRHAIGGAAVFDADFTNLAKYTDGFTCSTGHRVVLNGQSGKGVADPKFLPVLAQRYIYIPATSTNTFNIPDDANLNPGTNAGDTFTVEIVMPFRIDTYNGLAYFASKSQGTGGAGSETGWVFRKQVSGNLLIFSVGNGVGTATQAQLTATVALPQEALGVRATFTANDGAGNKRVTFEWFDGAVWTQLGAEVVVAGVQVVTNNATPLKFGALNTTNNPSTTGIGYKSVKVKKNAVTVVDIDCSVPTPADLTFAATSGQVVTITRPTTGVKAAVVDRNQFLFGTDDYMECPDPIDGSLDVGATESLSVGINLMRYTPQASVAIVAKRGSIASNGVSPGWNITNGATYYYAMISDAAIYDAETTSAIGAFGTDGVPHAVALVRDVPNDLINAYLDGANDHNTDGTTASLDTSLPLRIGRTSTTGASYADLMFFGLAVFKEALSGAEVNEMFTLMNAGAADLVVGTQMGTPTVVVMPVYVTPNGIASSEALGAPTLLPGPRTLSPAAIASQEAFGNPTVQALITLVTQAIPSAEAFGLVQIAPGPVLLAITGITSAEAFGIPDIVPPGIPWIFVESSAQSLLLIEMPEIELIDNAGHIEIVDTDDDHIELWES